MSDVLKILRGTTPVLQCSQPDSPDAMEHDSSRSHLLAEDYQDGPRVSGLDLPTQAQQLLEIASNIEIFMDEYGSAFGRIPFGNHLEIHHLYSQRVERWFQQEYHNRYSRSVNTHAVKTVLQTLEGKAINDQVTYPVHVRLAGHNGKIYFDLADENWQVVEIDVDGWRIVTDPPVRFLHPNGVRSLPVPERGGSVELLRKYLNLRSEDDWILMVAFVLAALRPTGPYPVTILHGEQGSAKSTTARVIRELVDPNTASLRSAPKDDRDLMIAASNSWVLSFDNMTYVSQNLSNALCRLSTGGGFATRKLYSDNEEMIFTAQRPVILNGISDIVSRSDLLDRSIIFDLPRIPAKKRQTEEEFWNSFRKDLPLILGAFLDVVTGALCRFPETSIAGLPRMADFAIWATSAEDALGWGPGTFMAAYTSNQSEVNQLALDASPLAQAIVEFAEDQMQWAGTATGLLVTLNGSMDESDLGQYRSSRVWPATPNILSKRLRELAPNLSKIGVELRFDVREPGSGKRLIQIFSVEK